LALLLPFVTRFDRALPHLDIGRSDPEVSAPTALERHERFSFVFESVPGKPVVYILLIGRTDDVSIGEQTGSPKYQPLGRPHGLPSWTCGATVV
jgi:hypothetical protein